MVLAVEVFEQLVDETADRRRERVADVAYVAQHVDVVVVGVEDTALSHDGSSFPGEAASRRRDDAPPDRFRNRERGRRSPSYAATS